MQGFLVALCCIVILGLCIMSGFGSWYFINSSAAESMAREVTETLTDAITLLAQGIFGILLSLAIGGAVWMFAKGTEPTARGYATYLLARRGSQLMIPGSGVETPDIKIWPPVLSLKEYDDVSRFIETTEKKRLKSGDHRERVSVSREGV